MHAIYYIPGKLYLDMGLREPKKRVKFDQPHLSEKVTAFNVFARYMHKFLYVFTDFQVPETPSEALDFSIISSSITPWITL